MSLAQVYITTGIHNVGGTWNGDHWDDPPPPRTAATIRGQITQFSNLKVSVPRKGYRTADVTVNLLSPELAQFYTTDDPTFSTYMNFLYITWRGHIVFWGPIITKEIDFEGRTLTLHAKDQAARLERNFFKIGDQALSGSGQAGALVWPFASVGFIPVNFHGVELCFQAVNKEENTQIVSGDPMVVYPPVIPFAVKMGSNNHTDSGREVSVTRGQEIWRTIQDIGDRTDGWLLNFVPLDPTSGPPYWFARCDVYGQFRDDVSSTVKFHYNTGLNNVRNIQPVTGGEVTTRANVLSDDKRWNVYSLYLEGEKKYGIWVDWELGNTGIKITSTPTQARDTLAAVGDAVLDAYGIPLISVTITLNRDDVIPAPSLFYWMEDFHVSDIVEVAGARGPESFSGLYQIDAVRLEQENDNTGQMRQSMDVIPWTTEDRSYYHTYTKSRTDNTSSSSG